MRGVYLFFGAEGSGKSTHARLLAQYLKLPYLSSGQLLREEADKSSEIGKLFINKEGAYLSDELVIPLILRVLSAKKFNEGVVLEGFPRSLKQLEELEVFLEKKNLPLLKAIYITLPEAEAIRRLMNRSRKDDTPEKIKERLHVYKTNRFELLESLENKKILVEVSNLEPIEVVAKIIREAIKDD